MKHTYSNTSRTHRRHWRSWPIIRHIRAMQFRRLQPFWAGRTQGTPVVRYYWAEFLENHRADIRGRGLEIGETGTLRQYGGSALVEAEALDLAAHSPEVKVIADLSRADQVPGDRYDCFINQFSTAVIYDIEAALYHAIRLLKPGGVLLINFWSVDFYFHQGLDMGTGEPLYMYWWFTPIQVESMLRQLSLSDEDYGVEIYGNLLTRMAFLMNLPAEELAPHELDLKDPGHPLLICARIVKPVNWQASKPTYREPSWAPPGTPIQANPVTGHYGDTYLERRGP